MDVFANDFYYMNFIADDCSCENMVIFDKSSALEIHDQVGKRQIINQPEHSGKFRI